MKSPSLIAHDVVGAFICVAIVVAGAWCGISHLPATAKALDDRRGELNQVKAQLRSAEHTLREQHAVRDRLRADIDERGALPERSPIEADLRTIARIARVNRIELIEVSPAASKTYRGIAEVRYTIRARGSFEGFLGFLESFEASTFWADITSLDITANGSPGRDAADRAATMTVSLFASEAPEGQVVATK